MNARTVIRVALHAVGLIDDFGAWVDGSTEEGRVRACAYPRTGRALAGLSAAGIAVLVNLHERAHAPAQLARHGLREVHVPVRDFTAPTPAQLDAALAAIDAALAEGQRVAVHCGGGLGRTGTVVACYLVRRGASAEAAISQIRTVRSGAIETRDQLAAVHAFANRLNAAGSRNLTE